MLAGYAGIHYAAMEGNAPLMRFILAQGESIDRPFPDNCSQRAGYSPIMLAMEMSGGQMTEVIRVSPHCHFNNNNDAN